MRRGKLKAFWKRDRVPAFVAEIRANPFDDLPRLVFADYLEETGDPTDYAHGQFLRHAVHTPTLQPARVRLTKRVAHGMVKEVVPSRLDGFTLVMAAGEHSGSLIGHIHRGMFGRLIGDTEAFFALQNALVWGASDRDKRLIHMVETHPCYFVVNSLPYRNLVSASYSPRAGKIIVHFSGDNFSYSPAEITELAKQYPGYEMGEILAAESVRRRLSGACPAVPVVVCSRSLAAEIGRRIDLFAAGRIDPVQFRTERMGTFSFPSPDTLTPPKG